MLVYVCSCINDTANGIQSTSSSRFSTFSAAHILASLLALIITFINFPLLLSRFLCSLAFSLVSFSFFFPFATFHSSSLSALHPIIFTLAFSPDVRYSPSHVRDHSPLVYFPFARLILSYFCPRQKLRTPIKLEYSFK